MLRCTVLRFILIPLVLMSAAPLAAAEFQFDATGVTATVTPRAATYWACTCLGSHNSALSIAYDHAIVTDSDGDGIVRWELGDRMKPGGLFTMIDGTAGTITTRSRFDGALVEPRAFPAKAFLRDENGAYSRFVLNDIAAFPSDRTNFFWARPGVGAWWLTAANGGSLDEIQVGTSFMIDVRGMRPVGNSPAAPSGLRNGDFFIVTDHDADFWTGARVDPHLGEAIGGGVILPARIEGSEDAGRMKITFARTEGTDGAVSVRYATADGTASAGVHYQATSGTLSFGPGQIFAPVEVPLIDDHIDARSATFHLNLSEPSGATIGRPSTSVAIPDNDDTPVVSIERKTIVEDGSGPREVSLQVSLNHTAPQPVTLEWALRYPFGGTPFETGVLQFGAGEREKSIVIHYIADDLYGGTRIFDVAITSAVNARPGLPGRLIIEDDEPVPVMTITGATVSEGAGHVVVRVNISAPMTGNFLFYCETQDGTATAPGDYTAAFAGMQISSGETSTRLTIPIHDDDVIEGSESFRVILHGGLNGPESLIAMVTILDDDGPTPPRVTIEKVSVPEGDGPGEAVVTVALSAPAPQPVVLEWEAYDALTNDVIDAGVLQFAAGERTRPLPVRFLGDDLWGRDRRIRIAIAKVTNAIAADEGMVILVEDEPRPSISAGGAVIREGDGTAVLRVVLSAPARDPIRGTWRTFDGTAAAVYDFESRAGELVISPGSTAGVIEIPIVDDTAAEDAEAFTVVIEVAALARAPLTATVTVLDDDGPSRRRSLRH